MDIAMIAAEVAAAVGLAEGESGVRDILLAVARSEPVATNQIGRMAELPVPIVTAVCNELRKRGVIDKTRPVRLTARQGGARGGRQAPRPAVPLLRRAGPADSRRARAH